MFKQLLMVLKARLARRGRTEQSRPQPSTPIMEEIRKSSKRLARYNAIFAKQLAAERAERKVWRAKQEARKAKRESWKVKQEGWDAKEEDWDAKRARERARDELFLKDLYEATGLGWKDPSSAEKFFSTALEDALPFIIRGISFDDIFIDERYLSHQYAMDCYIVLVNDQYIAVVESEDFLEPAHVDAFAQNVKEVLPRVLPGRYRHLHIVPVMACMDLSAAAARKARAHGLALLRPHGQQPRVDDTYLRLRLPARRQEY